jgi:hypothetical protein
MMLMGVQARTNNLESTPCNDYRPALYKTKGQTGDE